MSFNHWNTYFAAHHQQQFSGIYWDDEDYLSSAERKLISSSIQQFQKGENSDGKNLLSKSAQLYDMNYTFAIQNFIKEEQNHSKALGTFMDLHSIERIQKHPLDVIFKSLLKFFSIGGIVVTLTTAEIISMVYYDALRKATGSKLLKDICTAILEDEVEHLKFQSQSLCAIYRTNFLKSILLGLYHSVLMRYLAVSQSHFKTRRHQKPGGLLWTCDEGILYRETQYLSAIEWRENDSENCMIFLTTCFNKTHRYIVKFWKHFRPLQFNSEAKIKHSCKHCLQYVLLWIPVYI